MVMARLHIICGNCGSNEDFDYSVRIKSAVDAEVGMYAVSIGCKNCATLHDLEDNAKELKG